MKTPKKFDVIVFAAFFICTCSLTATVIMQKSMKNKLFAYSAVVGGISNSYVYSAEKPPSVSKSTETTSEPMTDAVIGAVGYVTTEAAADNTAAEKKTEKATVKPTEKSTEIDTVLIVNKNSKKIHSSTCSYVSKMKDENKIVISSDELSHYLESGYTLCSACHGYKE